VADPATLFGEAVRDRQRQHTEAAVTAIDAAQATAPNNAQIAAVRAQLHYETWRPAAELFDCALKLIPNDLQLLRNKALALAIEGDHIRAQAYLEQQLAIQPDWIDGHNVLTKMRLMSGEATDYDRSFADACQRLPSSLPVRLAWFYSASIQRNWTKARHIIEKAQELFGNQKSLDAARLYIASESGDDADRNNLLLAVADMQDPGLDLCRVRLYLRNGQIDDAEKVAIHHIDTPTALMFWPYLSLIWRLTANPRAVWLDGDPFFVSIVDLAFSPVELDALADTLRKLHILQAPYPEQSVRGGTQTDRPLFFNPDPAIQLARARITCAVRNYVDALPDMEATHPLLSLRRDEIYYEGSWSVRLKDKGYHASHTHVMGWISSAFYVSLPDAPGPPPAGWLGLGTPPPELGLDLAAYAKVEPKPGRLALFPSTMWHSTDPFEAGERLTIAFDIRRPQ
jgi:tetratricopeptide (TPR) repeat protein